jgi:hypothetical protein
MKKLGYLCLLTVLISSNNFLFGSDTLSTTTKPEEVKHRFFANIFASHYVGFSESIKPKSAFEMPTALMGYSATFSNKLKATIIYDVTRTTSGFNVTDNDGNQLNINYFEGSKYTAFLKMDEIMYSLNQHIDFRVGQLLNTQYLTTQDRFWGYRYVYFTFQEVHRYGMPADFGAQIDIKHSGKILNQTSITNGEGPFRHQDENGNFLISNNFEFRPTQELILKLYADYCPSITIDRYAVSAFAGYKTTQYRFGLEYNKVYNYNFVSNRDFWGVSTFGSFSINPKFDILARYDYINKSNTLSIANGHFSLAGVQYKPHPNFFCSLNFRALLPADKYWVYSSFGVSF